MPEASEATERSTARLVGAAIAVALVVAWPLAMIADPLRARAAAIAGACFALWLSEAVPAFVPTLLLLAIVPATLGGLDARLGLGPLLATAADPVLALFFVGFALAAAATRHRVDAVFTHRLLRWSGGSRRALVAALLFGTAFLSMWMSYIAVAAMMMGAVAPLLARLPPHDRLRPALLLAVAVGANIGAMSTPVSSGPNAIAVGAAEATHPISFIAWMAFAVPLMLALLAGSFALIVLWFRVGGPLELDPGPRERLPRAGVVVVALGASAVALWLSEPLHGIGAPVVALGLAAALFATRLLHGRDLAAIDWSTLLLIAGGLAVGRLCEHAGLMHVVGSRIGSLGGDHGALAWAFVGLSAALASVMSNTGTAALLVPLALTVDPHPPSLAIMIALGASLGMPFAVSSPPNALAHGRGLRSSQLLLIGSAVMFAGCALIALTGAAVLARFGFG
jgi:sodium-dependent dicarboxylate transporter 2/3/5